MPRSRARAHCRLFPVADEPSDLQRRRSGRRDPPAPAVTFKVEREVSDDEEQITFSARPRAPRPTSLTVHRGPERSLSAEDPSRTSLLEPRPASVKRPAKLRKAGSAERLCRLKDKLMSRGGGCSRDRSSDEEAAPLVVRVGGACSPQDPSPSVELSPRSDAGSEGCAFDLLPEGKGRAGGYGGGGLPRQDSDASLGNMVEPYNLRLLARGASEALRLWRQDALDAPPWPSHESDSAV